MRNSLIKTYLICFLCSYSVWGYSQKPKIYQFSFEGGGGNHINNLTPSVDDFNKVIRNGKFESAIKTPLENSYSYSQGEYHFGYFARFQSKPLKSIFSDWALGLTFNKQSYAFTFNHIGSSNPFNYSTLNVVSNNTLANLAFEKNYYSPFLLKSFKLYLGAGANLGRTFLSSLSFSEFNSDTVNNLQQIDYETKSFSSIGFTVNSGLQLKLNSHLSIDGLIKQGYSFTLGNYPLKYKGYHINALLRLNWMFNVEK